MGIAHNKHETQNVLTTDGRIKAVAYIRESSDEGVKNSSGPENQLRDCRKYAEMCGFEILAVLSDEGVSGKIPIAKRPRGSELWRMVTNREVGAVVAARKDRYSRDEWGIELPTFLRHCTEHHVTVHASLEGGQLRADMAGRIQASFGDIMGGEERRKNWERMFEGYRATWEKGTLIPGGRWTPFGFRKIAKIEKNGRGTDYVRHDFAIDEVQADAAGSMQFGWMKLSGRNLSKSCLIVNYCIARRVTMLKSKRMQSNRCKRGWHLTKRN